MQNKKSSIFEQQLFNQRIFLGYCNDRSITVNEAFLNALEKEEFLKPLAIKQDEKYYSPHQIAVIALLRENEVAEGILEYPRDTCWVGNGNDQRAVRGIAFGNGYVVCDINNQIDNIREWCKTFHNFLKFIHSLEPNHPYLGSRLRAYTDSPSISYNFSAINVKQFLKNLNLDTKKLEELRHKIGRFAISVDPLGEDWFYYIQRHPQFRKDRMKGEAKLAQDLYCIDVLLSDVLEILEKKKVKNLLEFINEGSPIGTRTPRRRYVEGKDINAFKKAIELFKKWKTKKEHAEFVDSQTEEALKQIDEKILDFIKRYGENHFSYGGWQREKDLNPSITVESLDPEVMKFFEFFTKQIDDSGDPWALHHALDMRLNELWRELHGVLNSVGNKIHKIVLDKFDEQHNLGANRRWTQKEYDRLKNEINYYQEIERGFDDVLWYLRIIFCERCRSNPVPVRIDLSHGMPDAHLCENCIEEKKDDLQAIREAEWLCDCGQVLYKFAHQNILNATLQGCKAAQVTLEYGAMNVKTKCKSCRKMNTRKVEWGWLP